MKALSYIRVSSQGQREGDGPERQREAIARYAAANGIIIEHEYADLGISGVKELADRPGLFALRKHIEDNGVRVVLVERADRMARDLLIAEVIYADLRKLGVEVIAADSGTKLTDLDDDPTRKLVRQILGAIAEYAKVIDCQKMLAARHRMKANGQRSDGGRPLGIVSKRKSQDPETIAQAQRERTALTRIGELRAAGLNAPAIARRLNDEQVPTRSGVQWSRQLIGKIIKRG